MSETPPIVNLANVELNDFGKGERFSAKIAPLGRALGMQKIGCGLIELQPGKCAWPMHGHLAQEEAFVILEGHGVLRYADGEFPVKAGDVAFTPPGPDRAHQIVNNSDAPLKYLALSSMDSPEICYYPESGKVGAFHTDGNAFNFYMHRHTENLDYWDGENTETNAGESGPSESNS